MKALLLLVPLLLASLALAPVAHAQPNPVTDCIRGGPVCTVGGVVCIEHGGDECLVVARCVFYRCAPTTVCALDRVCVPTLVRDLLP